MTFCADRKSPKSCLGEGGFRFPPFPRYPTPLKRPIRGASAPLLDVPPGVGGNLQAFSARRGAEVNETVGKCGPGADAYFRRFCASNTGPGCGATTEPPRDGGKLGAMALVEASPYSSNTERQRAARGTVSWPLPALDEYNLAPWWLPRKSNGGPGEAA